VFGTIERDNMIEDGDRVLLAVSGEKDSTVMMDLVHKWVTRNGVRAELVVLTVDEGISDYRTRCTEVVRRHAERRGLEFIKRSYAGDFGMSLDQVHATREPDGRRICAYCCSLRGHVLRRVVDEAGATKIATGMNLNDAVEYAMMCLLYGHFDRQGLPVYSPPARPLSFVQPIYQLRAVECALYALLNQIEIMNDDCTYCGEHLHDDIRHSLNILEDSNPGILKSIYAGYVRLASGKAGQGAAKEAKVA
jgi:tRNA(Ile)-lysidine synthase TilS/MesJ